jgi:hypothetical protein
MKIKNNCRLYNNKGLAVFLLTSSYIYPHIIYLIKRLWHQLFISKITINDCYQQQKNVFFSSKLKWKISSQLTKKKYFLTQLCVEIVFKLFDLKLMVSSIHFYSFFTCITYDTLCNSYKYNCITDNTLCNDDYYKSKIK